MKAEFYKNNPEANSRSIDQSIVSNEFLITLSEKFSDPTQWDKLSIAQYGVSEVKRQMKKNLDDIIKNRDLAIVGLKDKYRI